jgi:hypothetical protein
MSAPRKARHKPALPYIKRSGKFHYFRRPGFPPVRLPGAPLSPEYIAAYWAARGEQQPTPVASADAIVTSDGQLVASKGGTEYVYVIGDSYDGPVKIGFSTQNTRQVSRRTRAGSRCTPTTQF